MSPVGGGSHYVSLWRGVSLCPPLEWGLTMSPFGGGAGGGELKGKEEEEVSLFGG
jgi:hypothetical protein